jgi:hypothetical protein
MLFVCKTLFWHLTLAFSGAANGIGGTIRNSLRGLRCNALFYEKGSQEQTCPFLAVKAFFSLIASPFRILEPSDFQSRCEVFALLSLRIFLLTRNQPLL